MTSPRRWLLRIGIVVVLVAAPTAAAWQVAARLLPPDRAVAEGVVVDGERVGPGQSPAAVARTHVEDLLARRVRLVDDGKVVLEASLGELGAHADEPALARELERVGHDGSLAERLDAAWQARRGKIALAVPATLPLEAIAERLAAYKEERDRRAVPSRWSWQDDKPTAAEDGLLVDVPAAAEAILAAARAHRAETALPLERTHPAATAEAVAAVARSELVSSYETRYAFVGNQAGRAKNIARAAGAIDGLVMMPGEVISFNELVGPRSEDNGFDKAGEIYKGEMRMGIGGGTCQVAGTFHAAIFFGGLEVVQRSNHSRPSGYIGIGLDATVAFPTIDLKVRNPYEFPIVVKARPDAGVLRVELWGRQKPAVVEYVTATIGIDRYKRKVEQAYWLEEGKVILKQKGRQGITVEKTRRIHYADGTSREEKTRDIYPPTQEIYYVAPGTDVATALPPLPEDAAG
jgi:vancomycin resistance protein YoaR